MLDGLFQSKRFWLSVSSILALIAIDQLNLPISREQLDTIALLIGAWIVGDSLRATQRKGTA